MTLQEAIEHCEEKAKGNSKCAEDHAQLAEWLKELEERRQADIKMTVMDGTITKDDVDKIYKKLEIKETTLPSTRLNTGSLKNRLTYSLNKKKINSIK